MPWFLGPSAALNRDPTATPAVNNFSQTVPQSSQPPCLVSRSGRLQDQGFSVKVQRELLPLRGHQQGPSTSPSGLYSEMVQRKFGGFLHSICETISDFMYLYQDLNRIIVGYRTAIVDTLGPAGHHIAQSSDLHRLLSSFHRDCPKSSRNLPK